MKKKKGLRERNSDSMQDEFKRIHSDMDRMVEDVFAMHAQNQALSRKHMPYIYGFSIKITPEGLPQVSRFGNTPPLFARRKPPVRTKNETIEFQVSREPLIDIIEGDQDLVVIAELPGAGKEDIHLNASAHSLTIHAFFHQKQFHRKIELPCEIVSKSAKAKHNNGVLEITFKRKTRKKKTSKKVTID
ncbi:Hsp20/alpha crystallin family protein [Candidatus Micrarchaeota archaeon]|nr:Hsp20/alpha crystallin family protein [Candidatus Micrarchaeota archaeon]